MPRKIIGLLAWGRRFQKRPNMSSRKGKKNCGVLHLLVKAKLRWEEQCELGKKTPTKSRSKGKKGGEKRRMGGGFGARKKASGRGVPDSWQRGN